MKKINNILELTECKNFISNNSNYSVLFCNIISNFPKHWTRCKCIGKIKSLIKIFKNNSNNHELLFQEYIQSTSTSRKIEILYGHQRKKEYTDKLKKRPRPKQPNSQFSLDYWLKQGHNIQSAKEKISNIQKQNAAKRTKKSYSNQKKKLKICIEYWTKLGYSEQEAELLREPYLNKCKNNLDALIDRYGIELGTKKYFSKIQKYKQSMIDNLHNRRSGGYVSKESIEFFIPLYKYCRRVGIDRDDICFGINGSKEFFIRDNSKSFNTGKFYDFTIKSLKLIIEYHGTYWHPKNIDSWNSTIDFQTAVDADNYKQQLAEQSGMQYIVVWSDDDLKQKYTELTQLIKEKYEIRN